MPIAVELDRLAAGTREDRVSIGRGRGKQVKFAEEPWFDTVVKGMGWWRVLYGDLRYASLPPPIKTSHMRYSRHHLSRFSRHALDLRLMTGKRIAILDGSYSLFQGNVIPPSQLDSGSGSDSYSHTHSNSDLDRIGLEPIPDFRTLVLDAVRATRPRSPQSGAGGRRIAPIDVGVVCEGGTIGPVIRALHERVLKKLRGAGG